MKRHFWLIPVAMALAATACGAQTATDSGPAPAATTPEPTPGSLAAPPSSSVDEGDPQPTVEEIEARVRNSIFFPAEDWPKTTFEKHSVPLGEFMGGGPGRDEISALDHPAFVPVSEADEWLGDREPVQLVNISGDARAYPQQVLIWHELVNDTVGGEPILVTF